MKDPTQDINNLEYAMRWLTHQIHLSEISLSILVAIAALTLVATGLAIKWALNQL